MFDTLATEPTIANDLQGWSNRATAEAVAVLYGNGYARELCDRAYTERVTAAKVEKEARRVYRDRFAILPRDHNEIDWQQIAEALTNDAKEWSTYQ